MRENSIKTSSNSPFKLAACAEMLYTDLPFEQRVSQLTKDGFCVELWDWTTKDLSSLAESGATFTSMTGYIEGNLLEPQGIKQLLETAELSIHAAKKINCRALNLHGTGLGEGGIPVVPLETVSGEMWIRAYKTLCQIADLAERYQQLFILENLNTAVDHKGTPFARAIDTFTLVSAVDSPWLKMNLDLYHAQIGEGQLIELCRKSLPYLGEIQVADVPGRQEPGTGEINYSAIAQVLASIGYEGVIGLEAFPSQTTVIALNRFRNTFTLS